MEELIAKLNEAKEIMRNLNVINCRIEGGTVLVLVNNFEDVPNGYGVEYHKCKDDCGFEYEKCYATDSATIHTFGTKADMRKEFAEVEK